MSWSLSRGTRGGAVVEVTRQSRRIFTIQIVGSLRNRVKLIKIYLTTKFSYPIPLVEVLREAFALPYFMIANKYIENISDINDFYIIKIKKIKRAVYWPKKYPLDGFLVVLAEMMNKNNWHYYQSPHTKVCKGYVIVDCGASEGLFTVINEGLFKKAYLFEPSKYFIDALNKTFQKNSQKIKIIDCALSDKNQIMNFDDDSISGKVGKHKNNMNNIMEGKKIDSNQL